MDAGRHRYSEMDQWVKDSAHQGDIPIGTKITMTNWQQYKTFMPLGMIKLFEGRMAGRCRLISKCMWSRPMRVAICPRPGSKRPRSMATDQFEVLPNGHYEIKNYYGGTPFPNPQEPYKGWKVLPNVFYAFVPSMYVNTSQ